MDNKVIEFIIVDHLAEDSETYVFDMHDYDIENKKAHSLMIEAMEVAGEVVFSDERFILTEDDDYEPDTCTVSIILLKTKNRVINNRAIEEMAALTITKEEAKVYLDEFRACLELYKNKTDE